MKPKPEECITFWGRKIFDHDNLLFYVWIDRNPRLFTLDFNRNQNVPGKWLLVSVGLLYHSLKFTIRIGK